MGFLWVLLAVLAYWLGSPPDAPLTWIICLTANIVGIPLGMAASPLEREGSHFRVLGGWIATFVSGYLLSKLDSVTAKSLVYTDLWFGRALLFTGFLVLGAVQTFVLRSYFDSKRPRDYYAAEADPAPAGNEP